MAINFQPKFGFISWRAGKLFVQFLFPYFVIIRKNGFKVHFCTDNKLVIIKNKSLTVSLQLLGFGFVIDY